MVKDYGDVSMSIDTVVHRLEDVEDNVQICRNDIDVARLRLSSVEGDIRLLEGSMDNAHQGIEDLGDRIDGFVSSLRTYNNQYTSSHRSLFQEMHQHKREARTDHESLLGKFARTDEVIDKRFVQLDNELEKVVGLVGDKIKKEIGKITTEFAEAMEVEEGWRATLESKVVGLEARLEEALEAISSLTTLVVSLQTRVGELEDAVMEEASDADGEGTAVSTSSSEFDPVENMVAIPIPPPVITLIPIEVPEAFIPPSLRTTLSPPYVTSREEDPESNGVPEFWADPAIGSS
jgi:chromosome segregation ATPase